MGEVENRARGAKSSTVSIAGIVLLCLGVLLIFVSAAALLSRSDHSAAIISIPGLLIAASGLATIRRWRGWRYYSGLWALLFAYAGLGSTLVGVKDLLIEALIPAESSFRPEPVTAFLMVFILIGLAIFGLGVFIIHANRREPLGPGQTSAEPAIIGGLFLLIGLGCWIGFVAGMIGEKGPPATGFLIAALIFTGIGLSLTLRMAGWTAVAAGLGWIVTVIGVLAMIVGTIEFLGSSFHPPRASNTAMGGVLFLLFGRYILAVRRQDRNRATRLSDREASDADGQPQAPHR
jgi:hypothetical protein